jgi:glycosyltransferase involved in cell wall biosynthesis
MSWRILHVSTAVSRGGAQNHLLDLVQHQRSVGMNVAVAYLRGPHRDLGVRMHDLALRFYGDPRPLVSLRRLIAAFQPDLVHAHMPPAELYSRLALAGMLITTHIAELFSAGPGERPMGRWVGRRASRVIAISQAVNRYMTGPTLGLDPLKMHTIYYGIDARPFVEAPNAPAASLRRQWGVPDRALVVGFAGRLVPQKSIDTLLEAFARFRGQTGVDAWLAIVGIGPLEPELRRQADELGVARRVVWAGFHEDMRSVMRAFDVFAISSVYEGFGLVLIEAMASGRPVVATRAGAIPEVVADGDTGLLVPPGDPQAFAAALARMTAPALRRSLGQAGQRRTLAEFTLDKMFARTDALYADILAPRLADSSSHASRQRIGVLTDDSGRS